MKTLSTVLMTILLVSCGSNEDSRLNIIGGIIAPNNQTEKGVYPATIGIWSANVNQCTGVRISKNLFLSAAHCLDKSGDNERVMVFASNSRKFDAYLKNIRVHSSWQRGSTTLTTLGSDVALFELAFASREERTVFDGFVDIAPVDYDMPQLKQPVTAVGFGCEKKVGLPTSKCLQSTDYKYIKYASNYVYETPMLGDNLVRYFQEDASSDKPNANGFVAEGDSGGPTYSLEGKVIGLTHAADFAILTGEDAFLGLTRHAWLGYPDVKTWIQNAIATQTDSNLFTSTSGPISVTYANGDSYIGQFSNGFRSGQGTMAYSNGKTYSGNWSLDARSGFGEQTWPAGSKYSSYKGTWANDLPNGTGVMIYPSGLIYTGQFVDAILQGDGQMKYANGDIRTGKFINNKREGEFILVTADGRKYREQFSGDVRTSVEEIK